jgi:hypothetical protein
MRGRDAATGYNPSVHVTQLTGKFQMLQKWDFHDFRARRGRSPFRAGKWSGNVASSAPGPWACQLMLDGGDGLGGPPSSASDPGAAAPGRDQAPEAGPAVPVWERGSAARGVTGPAASDRDRAPAGTALVRGLAGWSCFPLEGSCGLLIADASSGYARRRSGDRPAGGAQEAFGKGLKASRFPGSERRPKCQGGSIY